MFFYVNSLAYAQEDIPDRSQKSSIKKFPKDNKRKAGLFFTDSGASYRWNEDRNEIRLGGFIQADSHTFFNDVSESGNDNFTLRRIRPVLEIRFGKIYSFYVMPNLESSPGILDAFLKAITSGHANLPTFISPGQQLIASYTQDAFASGSRERIGPQLYYHSGPFGIMAEYTISQQKIKIGTTSDKVANDARQVQISWIIFNGDASFRRVQPRNPVTFESLNAVGAIQLVTRYSELNLDAKAFTHGLFNPDRSVIRAQDFGVGINWYLNHNIKLQLSYNQTHFTHGAVGRFDRPTEKILFSRMQVTF